MENYTDFEKLSHIIEHSLQGFTVINIEGDCTMTLLFVLFFTFSNRNTFFCTKAL